MRKNTFCSADLQPFHLNPSVFKVKKKKKEEEVEEEEEKKERREKGG